MTDPELQALVLKMFDALMDRKPLERRAQADICARVAADFFAERLARLGPPHRTTTSRPTMTVATERTHP